MLQLILYSEQAFSNVQRVRLPLLSPIIIRLGSKNAAWSRVNSVRPDRSKALSMGV
jgi:hypothetical protein